MSLFYKFGRFGNVYRAFIANEALRYITMQRVESNGLLYNVFNVRYHHYFDDSLPPRSIFI